MARSTWVYTGRILEELLRNTSPALLDMLAEIDVLVIDVLVIGVPPPGFLPSLHKGLQALGVTVLPTHPWHWQQSPR